jgi:TonB family protein
VRIVRALVLIGVVAALMLVFTVQIRRSEPGPSPPAMMGYVAAPPPPASGPPSGDWEPPRDFVKCPAIAYQGARAPSRIADKKPIYPPAARNAGISGVVIVQVLIDKRGDVAAAKVVRSIPLLDGAALDAVRGWKFSRTTAADGAAVCVAMTVTVDVPRDPRRSTR